MPEAATPFAVAAQAMGYNYRGGKMDDITVVVGFIEDLSSSSSREKQEEAGRKKGGGGGGGSGSGGAGLASRL